MGAPYIYDISSLRVKKCCMSDTMDGRADNIMWKEFEDADDIDVMTTKY
jgi:hypothetical protein